MGLFSRLLLQTQEVGFFGMNAASIEIDDYNAMAKTTTQEGGIFSRWISSQD